MSKPIKLTKLTSEALKKVNKAKLLSTKMSLKAEPIFLVL
jgi:hypothetical protein